MKKILVTVLFCTGAILAAYSQPAPNDLLSSTAIVHYKLMVGYNTTTILIFPAPVKQADRGYKDVMAQKQPGVENVLKVKAARRDFPPTNLHVFTSDGKVYAFDVNYISDPMQTTYDLTKLVVASSSDTTQRETITFTQKPLNKELLEINVEKVKKSKPFFSTGTHKYRMKLQLQTIHLADEILFFGFEIANRSNLPYNIDFAKVFIQDKQRVKRYSVQQQEITSLYKDTLTVIPGNASVKWVLAVPKFTIPDHRQFVLEIYERNGGRHLTLEIKNRQLFEAKNLQ
jgi:conjugative transposon TraN protein